MYSVNQRRKNLFCGSHKCLSQVLSAAPQKRLRYRADQRLPGPSVCVKLQFLCYS